MAPPSSGITKSPSLLPHRSSHFTPIQEGNESSEEETTTERHRRLSSVTTPTPPPTHHHNYPPPLHPSPQTHHHQKNTTPEKRSTKRRPENPAVVSLNNCRPTSRDKTASLVVPVLDGGGNKHHHSNVSMPSPSNGILKSFLSSLSRRSPKHPPSETSSSNSSSEQWKHAATELSQKLVHASRKRDEAILEASKLKHSMTQLEKKLNKLEIYCHSLKSGLEVCSNNNSNNTTPNRHHTTTSPSPTFQPPRFSVSPFTHIRTSSFSSHEQILDHFLTSVSSSRSSIRLLSRALTLQIRQTTSGTTKPLDRITTLLQPYDIKLTTTKNPRSLVFYLESLLYQTLYNDFESPGFGPSSTTRILNPLDRCESRFAAYEALHGLTWEEVLAKGTKYFDEDFSRFCDRKMSEIVALLGWNWAWPEPLLQAFFAASKSVWLVHLLANSVHPALPVFRVESGVGFDPVYMEEVGGGGGVTAAGGRRLAAAGPSVVRIMVAPGFYVYDSVVKCKVICRYSSSSHGGAGGGGDVQNHKGLRITP